MASANHRFQYLQGPLKSRSILFPLCVVAALAAVYAIRQGTSLWVSSEHLALTASADNFSEPATPLLIHAMSLSEFGDFVDLTVWNATAQQTQRRRYDAHTGRELFGEQLCHDRLMRDLVFCDRTELWFGINESTETKLFAGYGRSVIWEGTLPDQKSTEELLKCSLCPSGKLLVVFSNLGSLWLVRYHDQNQISPSERFSLDIPCSLAVMSPDGSRLALVTNSQEVLIYDLSSQRVTARFQLKDHHTATVSWSRDAGRLITRGAGHDLAVWNSRTGGLMHEIQVRTQHLEAAALSSQGTLAAVSDGSAIRIWNLDDNQEQLPRSFMTREWSRVSTSPLTTTRSSRPTAEETSAAGR
jgi:WD40 repeat protein